MESTFVVAVGVDGSEDGYRALLWAAQEAAERGGTVHAVTAWRWDLPGGEIGARVRDDTPESPKRRAGAMLIREIATLPVPVAVAGQIVEGRAPDVLAEASRDADLLVLGSHGHGRTWHTVLGSVAEEVVRKATCPVVVVPVPGATRGRGGRAPHVTTFHTRRATVASSAR